MLMTNLDNLFNYIKSTDLLASARAGGHLPIYIWSYPPAQEDEMMRCVAGTRSNLIAEGKTVIHIDLFDKIVEVLREQGELEKLLEIESQVEKWEVADHINSVADFSDVVIPEILKETAGLPPAVLFLSGIGKCYPFLRTAKIVNGLENSLSDIPVVLFFPGNYDGWTMLLFGSVPEHTYRGINLSGQLNKE